MMRLEAVNPTRLPKELTEIPRSNIPPQVAGVLAATSGNPMLGLAANAVRHRSPMDGNLLPNLGKSLTHHQVLPASMAKRIANTPRTDFGKAVMSATGGNPRAVNQAVQGITARAVGQISHLDRRLQMAKGIDTALKLKPHAMSLISN